MAKKSSKKDKMWLAVFGGFVVIGFAIAYIIVSSIIGSWNPLAWGSGKRGNEGTGSGSAKQGVLAVSDTGEAMYAGETYVMPRGMAFLTALSESEPEALSDDGLITVKAVLSNEYIIGDIIWELSWTGDNEWSDGMRESDYVELIMTEGVTDEVKLRVLQPFGDTIDLYAVLSDSNATVSAYCRIDYIQRPLANVRGLSFLDFGINNGYATVDISYGIGTVRGTVGFSSLTLTPNEPFKAAMRKYTTLDLGVYSTDLVFDETLLGAPGTGDNFFTQDSSGTRFEPYVKAINYSDFVSGFDNYTQEQQEAVYYAWWRAYCEYRISTQSDFNMELSVDFNYDYLGLQLESVVGTGIAIVSGEAKKDILPSLTLNPDRIAV